MTAPRPRREVIRLRLVAPVQNLEKAEEMDPVAARTVEADLPAQTTLDQAIVALLKLRRRDVPGDATLDQPAVLRFVFAILEEATP